MMKTKIPTQTVRKFTKINSHQDHAIFSEIIGALPAKLDMHHRILKASCLNTKLGPMIAISDDKSLYLLEFLDGRGVEREVEKLKIKTKAVIIPEMADPIRSIETELHAYFEGTLTVFKTPLHLLGSPFQKLVWEELIRIPYGVTRSYLEQSIRIGKNKAYRAVANANGANQLSIVIPCHRVINNNGELGGYGGGITRKQWMLDHEKKYLPV